MGLEGANKDVVELRNLTDIYKLTDTDTDKYVAYESEDESDEPEYNYSKSATYIDDVSNNKIVFEYYGAWEPDDIPEDFVDEICDGIIDSAYDYLISVLKSTENVTVLWSKIEATTSDYTIYHGGDINVDVPEEYRRYKYLEVINGVCRKAV